LTDNQNRAIISSDNGKSSGKTGDAGGMTTITNIKHIDFNDKMAIEKEIDEKAITDEIEIIWDYEEIMRILDERLEGFKFYENF